MTINVICNRYTRLDYYYIKVLWIKCDKVIQRKKTNDSNQNDNPQ